MMEIMSQEIADGQQENNKRLTVVPQFSLSGPVGV
jgi:hypothetical protein